MKTRGNVFFGKSSSFVSERLRSSALRVSVVLCALTMLLTWAILSPAVAGALPANLLTNPGTQLSGFETKTDWAIAANGTTSYAIDVNPAQYREGANSLKLTATAGSSAGGLSFTKSINADMSGTGSVRFWVYLHTDPSTATTIGVRFSPDSGTAFTNYYRYDATGLRSGWNLISAAKSDFTVVGGTLSWSSPMLKVRIALTAKANTTAAISFDDLRFGVVSQPVVLLSFKNGTTGQSTNAAPIMAAHGFSGNAFVDSADVGKTGQMTLAQMQTLYAAGWDIGNHSTSSAQLTTLSLADAKKALSDCTNYLTANGMPRGARHVAYVDGMYNDTVLQAMHDTGMLTGTTVSATLDQHLQPLPMDNPYVVPSWDAGLLVHAIGGGTGGVAAVTAKIDGAVSKGAPIQLVFHDIQPIVLAGDIYTVSSADFTAICDYIRTLGIPTPTISQLYGLNVDPAGPLQNDRWAPKTTASTVAAAGGGRTVTLSAVDSLSGVKATYYNLDGAGEVSYLGPFPLLSGSHTLIYRSVDNAGNAEASTTMTDFQPPVSTCTGSEGGWVSGKGSLTLTATDVLSGGSAVREIDYSLDNGQTWVSAPGSSASVSVPTEGPVTLIYHAVDAAGNIEADNTLHALVDNIAPTSTLLGVDTLAHNAPVTLTLAATDAAAGTYAHGSDVASVSYRVDTAPAVTTAGAGPLAVTLGEGNHYVSYWSTDNAGNAEAARTVYVRVAAPLPPNLIKDPGTQISSFDNASDWTLMSIGGTGGSLAANTSQVKEGSGSLQLTTGVPATAAGTVIAQKSLGSGVDMSSMLDGAAIRFWVYVHTDMSPLSPNNILTTFRLRLSPDADATGSFVNQFYWGTNRTAIHTGWNLISLSASDFTVRGNASWSRPMLWARVEVTANSGQTQTASVSFDDLRYGVRATPAVIMSFDDGDATVYNAAFPIMAARGILGTSYVISSQVGNSEYPETMTLAQVTSLYASGWDIGNHSVDHTNLTTLSVDAAQQELSGCAAFLTANGMTRGARHVAYPGGTYNATVQQAMAAAGMLTGRIVSWRPMALPIDDPYQIPGSTTAPSTLTLQQIEGRIDQAVNAGATIQLFFHSFGDPATDPTYIQSVEEFTAICDYIAQRGIPTMTISQFYAHSQYGAGADSVAPVTTADYDGSWHKAPLTVHFTATDSGSGVDYTQYSLDGGVSWTVSDTVTIASLGANSISFRSADQAGNLEQTKIVPVKIDATAPLTTAAAQPSGWTNGAVTVTLSATDAGGSGLAGTSYQVGQAGAVQSYTGPITLSGQGEPTVYYWSTDTAGNKETASSVQAHIDTTAPQTTAAFSPGAAGQAIMTLSATDTGGSSVVATYYKLDGAGDYFVYQGPVTVVADGAHTVTVYSVDAAGNAETARTITIPIDTVAPVTTSDAPAGWQKGPLTVHFSATDAGSGVDYTKYSLDGGVTWTIGTSVPVSAQGTTTIRYYSADRAGNVEQTKTATVMIDATAPLASAVASPASWTTGNVTVTFSATDTVSGLDTSSATCKVDGAAVAFVYGAPVAVSTEGSHVVAFTIKDLAGNTATAQVNALIDRTAPSTSVDYDGSWRRTNVTLHFSATDTGGSGVASTQSSTNGGATWTTSTSRTITTSGQTTVMYRSTDKVGNVEAAHTVVVRIDKTAPTITVRAPQSYGTYLQGQVVTADWSATDAASGINAGSTSSSPVANGAPLPTSTFGTKTFTVVATDNAGNSRTRTVTYSVSFASTGVLAPINTDGSSSFTLGAVVPVSFVLTNSSGGAYSTAHPRLNLARKQTNGTWGSEQAAVASPSVSGGNTFTYAGSGRYTFNLRTSVLTAGTWRLRIDLGGGGALYAQLSLM